MSIAHQLLGKESPDTVISLLTVNMPSWYGQEALRSSVDFASYTLDDGNSQAEIRERRFQIETSTHKGLGVKIIYKLEYLNMLGRVQRPGYEN